MITTKVDRNPVRLIDESDVKPKSKGTVTLVPDAHFLSNREPDKPFSSMLEPSSNGNTLMNVRIHRKSFQMVLKIVDEEFDVPFTAKTLAEMEKMQKGDKLERDFVTNLLKLQCRKVKGKPISVEEVPVEQQGEPKFSWEVKDAADRALILGD